MSDKEKAIEKIKCPHCFKDMGFDTYCPNKDAYICPFDVIEEQAKQEAKADFLKTIKDIIEQPISDGLVRKDLQRLLKSELSNSQGEEVSEK